MLDNNVFPLVRLLTVNTFHFFYRDRSPTCLPYFIFGFDNVALEDIYVKWQKCVVLVGEI